MYKYRNIQQIKTNVPCNQLLYAWFIWNRICKDTFIVHISVIYVYFYLLINNKGIKMAKYTRSHLNDRVLVKLINYDNKDYSGKRRLVLVGDSCQMSVINHVIAPTFYCVFTLLWFISCHQVFITFLNLVFI